MDQGQGPEEDKVILPGRPQGSHHLPWDEFSIPTKAGCRARGRRLGWRTCLRKGCGRRFQARRHNQRYCREPECLDALRRWQAAKRQQKRRAGPEGRQRHAEAERQRRRRKTSRADVPEGGQTPATTAAGPARGHAAKNIPKFFAIGQAVTSRCENLRRAPASYCGDECRAAMKSGPRS